MKICINCKRIFTDDIYDICPTCKTLLNKNYQIHNKEGLLNDIKNDGKVLWKISWRIFIMLFSIFGVIGFVTGFNIYNYFNQLSDKINKKIEDEFAKPKITETVKKVAQDKADILIKEKINPEVGKFKLALNKIKNDADLYLEEKINQFKTDIDKKAEYIDINLVTLDKNLDRIEESKENILNLEEEIKHLKEIAKPPTLKIKAMKPEYLSDKLKLIIQFEPSKNEPLGNISFNVKILNSNEKILKFYTEAKYGSFSGESKGEISSDKKYANYNYALITPANPTIIIDLSDKTDLLIKGNYLEEPISILKTDY